MSHYGLFVKGKMLGSRQRNRLNSDFVYNEIGVGMEKPDGFGGTKTEQLIVRVSPSLVKAGVMNQAKTLIGKLVQVPVYAKVWSFDGKEGITYHLSNDGGISEIKA